jgi:hypothetical protein
MDIVIRNAQIPKTCITLDGKYCFYVEHCPAFREADFSTRRYDGVKGRLKECPMEERECKAI